MSMVTESCSAHAPLSFSSDSFPKAVGRAILGLAVVLSLIASPTDIFPSSAAGKKSTKQGKSETVVWNAEAVPIVEEAIIELTNAARKEKGLNQVVQSSALTFLGRGQSKNMCGLGKLAHESEDFPEGWRRFMQRLGMVRVRSGAENIAFHSRVPDPRQWASAVVKGWLRSRSHAKNLLDPKWRYIGVGIGLCGDKMAYVAQEFSMEPGITPQGFGASSDP
jgi:uncharacterized protein YkwD